MTIDAQNPLGLDGFAFVEFTSPEPAAMKALFEQLGFVPPRPIRPRP
jgi:4-hydroxyphenylpyruvate dioxygenase